MPTESGYSAPEIIIPAQYLAEMDMGRLQSIADQVGVGYAGLDEDELRGKLVSEGIPVEV